MPVPVTVQDTEGPLRSQPRPPPLRVELVDAETGVGAFATRRYEAGDGVLCEAPVVFAQSYETWNTSPADQTARSAEEWQDAAWKRLRCCFGCGAPLLGFLAEECARLDRLQQRESEAAMATAQQQQPSPSPPLPSTWALVQALHLSHLAQAPQQASAPAPDAATALYAVEVDEMARQHIVRFCSPTCEARSLADDGRRFVLWPPQRADPEAASTPATAASPSTTPDEDLLVDALRYPSADAVLAFARHAPSLALRQAAWPARRHVLCTLHAVARRCNERVWLITLLLAKQLHRTLTAVEAPEAACGFAAWLRRGAAGVAVDFRGRLEVMLVDYAEGAMQLLSPEQRALLRFSWYLLTWWWLLCCAEAYADSQERVCADGIAAHRECHVHLVQLLNSDALETVQSQAFPLQLYLQLYWLTNANAHMYVVVSPLYTLWCRWLQVDGHVHRGDGDEAVMSADAAFLFHRLYALFHDANPHAAGLRNTPAPATAAGHGTFADTSRRHSDGLHATGVALYDRATKLNHSCEPNVCFQATSGAVAAAVVALRSIEAGEQLFTSYIRVDDFGDRDTAAAAARRRRYLEDHYGFACWCPLCTR